MLVWLIALLLLAMIAGATFGTYSSYMEIKTGEPKWKVYEKSMFILFGMAGIIVGLLTIF